MKNIKALTEKNLAESLDLGRVDGDVKARIDSNIYGLAYGLTSRLTIFAGIPYIKAEVDAEMQYRGPGNADQVKAELGDLAYQELYDGLTEASRIDTTRLHEKIAANGYQSIDHWEHQGYGDLRLGLKTGVRHPTGKLLKSGLTATTTLMIPTGYVERPDYLTDISFGTGFYAVNLNLEEAVTFRRRFVSGFSAYGQYNHPTKRRVRVPEGQESIVSSDREVTATLIPGHDYGGQLFAGWDFGLIDARYGHGIERHLADRYEGSLVGNYDALGRTTDTFRRYHEGSLRLDTVAAYRRGKFIYPMQISLHHRRLSEGKNATDERFYELRLVGFFSSPQAR